MAEDEVDPEEADPFAGLTLDDEFVRGAKVSEESATARIERLRRIDADHARLQRERERERRSARRARRRDRGKQHLVLFLFLGALVGLAAWNYVKDTRGSDVATGLSPSFGDDGRTRSVGDVRPPAGVDSQDAPLGQPAPLTVESDAYRFLQHQPGKETPVAYDPCRPIHVVVNEDRAVAGANAILQRALAATSAATGLQFVVDGTSDEPASLEREAYQPDRYPGRWAPVLVVWTDPGEIPGLEGDTAGLGGSASVTTDSGAVYVSGSIELDAPQLAHVFEVAGPDSVQAVIEHELGHIVGLDHVEDPAQLMNPVGSTEVTTFAAGDLTGLATLGRGRCFPEV
jgi:hypothetical protein